MCSTVSLAVVSKAERISRSSAEASVSSARARVRSSPRPPRRTRAAPRRQPESRRRLRAGDRAHRRPSCTLCAEPVEQRPNVRPAATGDGAPVIAAQPEHRVVAEEVDPVGGREVERRPRRGRPQRGGHRHQVVPSEGVRSSPRRRGSGRTTCRRCRRLPRCAGTGGSPARASVRRARAVGSTIRARTRRRPQRTSPTTGSPRRARGRGASGSDNSPRCER